jgi:uncharacterized protein YutD
VFLVVALTSKRAAQSTRTVSNVCAYIHTYILYVCIYVCIQDMLDEALLRPGHLEVHVEIKNKK